MRILIVKLSSLGDLFHALPTVHALKTGLGASIDWVVTDMYRELAGCFDDVERLIPYPRRDTLACLPAFLRDLHRDRYDAIVDLQGLLKSAVVTRLARGRKRVGPSFHREGSRLFYHATAPAVGPSGVRHAVDACLDTLACFGLPRPEVPAFPVTFPSFDSPQPRPWIAVAPASRWQTKNWPPERFAAAAQALQQRHGGTVFLIGATGDATLCSRIAAELADPVEMMAGRLSLVESAGLLQAADVLLSNDSGPSHVAAATGTPCVVVFGPTDPARTGPYGKRHAILKSALKCGPCGKRSCSHTGIPCMSGIQTYQMVNAADRILGSLA